MFVFTHNRSLYKDNLNTLITKMVIIKESRFISLDEMSLRLGCMGIDYLNIFSISINTITNTVYSKKHCLISYVEISPQNFVELLNHEDCKFLDMNKDSLFIVRGGNWLDIKNLFAAINNRDINIGRGGSQKAHALSPLDFRLSTYLMAMFNFDYNLISSLNSFNVMSKDRYLSYMDRSSPNKFVSIKLDSNLKD